jgi:osmotically-inducible protein OsmY
MPRTDEEIKKDIIDHLYWDTRVDAADVTVEVKDGIVTLGGHVPTYLSRDAAARDAMLIWGIKDVINFIEVHYPTTITPPADEEIRTRIANMLSFNPDIDSSDIDVQVTAGGVTLSGSVDSLWKKFRAEDLISSERGVLSIENHLAVVPMKTFVDRDIAEEVVGAIDRSALVDAKDVDVTVKERAVSLTGAVPTWSARRGAYEAALYTAGVENIHDNLTVSGTI